MLELLWPTVQVVVSADLDRKAGARLYLKAESMQVTGSFKIRGATNSILQLSDEQLRLGVVTHRWVCQCTCMSSTLVPSLVQNGPATFLPQIVHAPPRNGHSCHRAKFCLRRLSFCRMILFCSVAIVDCWSAPDRSGSKAMLGCSSGNHGAALAHAAKAHGAEATIIMPSNAPKCKIAAARGAGGDVVLCEATIEARTAAAQKHMEEHPRCTLIPPYNHPHIISGQGTVALELLQQVSNAEVLQLGTPTSHEVADDGTPDSTLGTGAEEPESDELLLDAVVVPVSGGGLISGIATAIKTRLPQCKVLSCCTVVPAPTHSRLPPAPANTYSFFKQHEAPCFKPTAAQRLLARVLTTRIEHTASCAVQKQICNMFHTSC